MSRFCGEQCPVNLAREHALEVMSGLGEHPFGVAKGLPNREEQIESFLNIASFGDPMEGQTCEQSCRVLRGMFYATAAGGTTGDTLKLLASVGQEI